MASETESSILPINMKELKDFIKKNSMNKDKSKGSFMNIVNNLNPKSTDKKFEINFNQYDIKIVPREGSDKKNESMINKYKEENIAKQNENTASSQKIVINKSLSKKIILKLDNKDGNGSRLNIQKYNDNINIKFLDEKKKNQRWKN